MALIDDVKMSLRILHNALDADVGANIAACKKDLSIGGVEVIDDSDALTIQAVKLYCRWQFDFNAKGEQHQKAYSMLRESMALSGDYSGN